MILSKITITVRGEHTGEPINYSNPAGENSLDCSDVDMEEVLDRVVHDVDGGLKIRSQRSSLLLILISINLEIYVLLLPSLSISY